MDQFSPGTNSHASGDGPVGNFGESRRVAANHFSGDGAVSDPSSLAELSEDSNLSGIGRSITVSSVDDSESRRVDFFEGTTLRRRGSLCPERVVQL